MKKNNIKPLVMSALTALAMGAVGTVGTFALFTDKAETEISIGSGTVKIGTVATLVKYQSSVDGTNQDLTGETSYVNTLVGSSFGLDGNTINISKMVPGDKLTLRVVSKNESDIKTKIRYVISHAKVGTKKDLFPALKVNFEPEDNATVADLFHWTQHDAAPSGGEEIHSTLVTVEFPNHGFEITSRDEGIDNQYQDAACSISFALEAVQANAALDPIEEINAYLKAELFFEGHNDTMHDAVIDMAEIGYTSLSVLDGYVYEYAEDRFVAADSVTSDYHKYFKAVSYQAAAGNFSIYAANDWNDANVDLTGVGFDVGNSEVVESVTYNGASDARTNIIRTNSLATNVTIDAENDTVYRYGSAGVVNIIAVHNESYHEHGKVAFLQVASGRVALEKESEVAQIHFAYNGTEKKFDEIIVAYDEEVELPTFSRDAVPLADIQDNAKLVVELQNSTVKEEAESDFVWLFQQGLKEQMRVSATAESAGDVKATDSSVKEETSKAAEEIANNFTATAQEYTPAEIAAGNVDASDIAESGMEADKKEEIISEKVEQAITDEALEDKTHNYVARIGTKYYESFDDAFAKAVSGNTIRIIGPEVENENGKIVYASHKYDASGMNLNIHVDKDLTLACGDVTNGKFDICYNNASGTFTLEGEGRISFEDPYNHGLVRKQGSNSNAKIVARNLTVEADASSYLSLSSSLTIESGSFKNIIFMSGTRIIDGLFTTNVDDYLDESYMDVAINDPSSEYTHTVGNLTPERANFSVLHGGEYKYFRTITGASAMTHSGDIMKFIGSETTYISTSSEHLFVEDGATYDLNGHTLYAQSGYGFYFGGASKTITMKNGSIYSASQLCEENSIYTLNLVADELAISSKIKVSALSHIHNGYFVQTSDDYFSIKDTAPETYGAKIARNDARQYYFYDYECAVAAAFADVKSGDHVFVNQNEANVQIVLENLNDYVDITLADGVQEPSVVSSAGDISKTDNSDGSRRYTATQAVICTVGGTSYYTLAEGLKAMTPSNGGTATLTLCHDVVAEGASINSSGTISYSSTAGYGYKIDTYWIRGATYVIDFNGHTIYARENTYQGLFTINRFGSSDSSRVANLKFTDSSINHDGGLNNTTCTSSYISSNTYLVSVSRNSSSTKYHVQFENGRYEAKTGSNLLKVGANQTVVISGGTFLTSTESLSSSNPFYVDNGLSISGGVFREEVFVNYSTKIASGKGKAAEISFEYNGKDYYAVVAA